VPPIRAQFALPTRNEELRNVLVWGKGVGTGHTVLVAEATSKTPQALGRNSFLSQRLDLEFPPRSGIDFRRRIADPKDQRRAVEIDALGASVLAWR
jgi:hypothetical protein